MENGLYSFDAIEFILFMSFCMRLDLFLLIRVLSLRPTAWALISFILNVFRETKWKGCEVEHRVKFRKFCGSMIEEKRGFYENDRIGQENE